MNFKFINKSSKIIPSIEMIQLLFKFIWHTLAESHLNPYVKRYNEVSHQSSVPQYVYIPYTHLTIHL